MSQQHNLEVFVKEAERLVDLETDILQRIRQTDGLLRPRNEKEHRQSLDQTSVDRILSVLAGEKHKLTHMDMVIAVIGTMKAGKSTTINAIVGSEVLPNRNAAMTALPTLIRHEPGLKEPRLSLQNPDPIRNIIQQAQDKLSGDQGDALRHQVQEEGENLRELARTIEAGLEISESYQGRPAIFRFLWWINDLIRLCYVLGIDFPFHEYDDVDRLPVISVEFAHLKTQSRSKGRLTLLDTPGPNEAGQKHLRHMIADQLDKASAVISVLNYTQLKTQADQDLREQLVSIGDVAKGRIFALVNRYDEKGRNDPDEEAVRSLVADNLLKGVLEREHVFAVSALEAYLANSALKCLDEQGQLPDIDDEGWVAEFGSLALGKRWERRIDDLEEVRESADEVWTDSGFGHALEEVVVSANRNAPFYALDSAASKLVRYAESISNFINGRAGALCRQTVELEQHVTELQQDVQRIERLRSDNEAAAETLMEQTRQSLQEELEGLSKVVTLRTDQFFQTGRSQHLAEQEQERRQLQSSSAAERMRLQHQALNHVLKQSLTGQIAKSLMGNEGISTEDKETVMDPNEREITFKTREEADYFVENLDNAFQPILRKGQLEAEEQMKTAVRHFEQRMNSDMAKESRELLESIMARFGKAGFRIRFTVPDLVNVSSKESTAAALKLGIQHERQERKRLREQSGMAGGAKRLFGKAVSLFGAKPDWGYDQVTEEIEVYQVALDDLQARANTLIEGEREAWMATLEAEVEQPIREHLLEFFNELSEKVSAVRSDLLQGIDDRRQEKAKREALAEVLQQLDERAQEMADDSEWLDKESKKAFVREQQDV